MRPLIHRWRITTSVALSLAILVMAVLNRDWLLEAFSMVQEARPFWLVVALATILVSYFITSQVLVVALRSLGYKFGLLRIWAITLVAVVFSQSVPAGGLGSYAFLVGIFNRQGVPSGKATLAASLEMLSYISAMLLVFLFSLIYLLIHGLGANLVSYVAAGAAVLLVSGAVFVLTRSTERLTNWLMSIKNSAARLFRRNWSDDRVHHIVDELTRGRTLMAESWHELVWLIPIQIAGLCGHSLAMLMVFWSLGVETSFFVVLTAFGIALITSTFNVLPGGGGTVEAALGLVLNRMGTGMAAFPAAIIFRLLNFWLILPVAAGCYYWLMHYQQEEPREDETDGSQPAPDGFTPEFLELDALRFDEIAAEKLDLDHLDHMEKEQEKVRG
jgi:uncharacterized protein (TIRG00374 family)